MKSLFIKNRTLEQYIDLIHVLLRKELTVRYKGSILGYLWSVMNPLAYGFVFYFALGIMLRVQMENYLVFLLAGMFPWQWMSNSVNSGTFLYLGNASLIKKVAFKRYFLNIVLVLQEGVHFLLAIPVFLFFKAIKGVYPIVDATWLYGLPLLFLISLGLITGITLICGTLNIFLRDIGNLVTVLVNLLFYCTPVLYPLTKVPEQFRGYILANPATSYIECWRQLLMNNYFDWQVFGVLCIFSALSLGIGMLVFYRLQSRFAEAL